MIHIGDHTLSDAAFMSAYQMMSGEILMLRFDKTGTGPDDINEFKATASSSVRSKHDAMCFIRDNS